MKRRRVSLALFAVLLCFALIAGTISYALPRHMQMTALAAENQSFDRQSVEKASVAFESAETILEKLQSMVSDELAGYDDDYDDEEDEFDLDEAETFMNELGGDMVQIDMLLASLDGLKDDMDSSEGKTVLAVREYLNMLRYISLDMHELLEYYMELYEALMVFDELDEDTDSYTDFALSLTDITGRAVELMEKTNPPLHLKLSHDDLTLRFREFRDFGEDFYTATSMEDPLRIYSCVYRMNRIEAKLGQSVDNLIGDVKLQFEQADKRLGGQIATLHNELESNIALLLEV